MTEQKKRGRRPISNRLVREWIYLRQSEWKDVGGIEGLSEVITGYLKGDIVKAQPFGYEKPDSRLNAFDKKLVSRLTSILKSGISDEGRKRVDAFLDEMESFIQ